MGDGPGGKSEEEIHGNCDFSPKMNVFSLKIPRSLKGNVSPFFLCGEGGGVATKMVSAKTRNVHVNWGLIRLQSDLKYQFQVVKL